MNLLRIGVLAFPLILSCGPDAAASSGAAEGNGGSGAEPSTLDCAWLTSAANCWQPLAEELLACYQISGMTGVFDDRRQTCTFPDGVRVDFDEPVPALGHKEEYNFRFRVLGADAFCFGYRESETTRTEFETSSGVVWFDRNDERTSVGCPDGSSYSATRKELRDCTFSVPSRLAFLFADGRVIFEFFGEGLPESGLLVHCEPP